jgi:hypothetical protein
MQDLLLSVVVCSVDSERQRRIAAHYAELFSGRPFEFVLIEDAKSLCEGYNRAIEKTVGELLVFSHDDIRANFGGFESGGFPSTYG